MKYIESPSDLELWNYDFLPKTILAGILATYATYGSIITLDDFGDI